MFLFGSMSEKTMGFHSNTTVTQCSNTLAVFGYTTHGITVVRWWRCANTVSLLCSLMQLSAASNSISLSKNSTPIILIVLLLHCKIILDVLTIQVVKIVVAHTQHSEVVLGSSAKWRDRGHTIKAKMQERSCINVLKWKQNVTKYMFSWICK